MRCMVNAIFYDRLLSDLHKELKIQNKMFAQYVYSRSVLFTLFAYFFISSLIQFFFFSLEALKNISKTAATISQNVCVYISLKFHVAVDLMDFQQSKIRTEHHWLSNLMSDHFEFICRSALLWQEFFSE